MTAHRCPRRLGARIRPTVAMVILASCGGADAGTGPALSNGSIQVRVTTGGTPIDPTGYTVSLDGGSPVQLPLNGIVGLSAAPGERRLEFSGWRFNCTSAGPPVRSIMVAAGEIAETTLEVECSQAPPAGRGREIVFATRRDGVGELYIMNDDGSGLVRITTDQTDHEPAWSPDGSRIALRQNLPSGNRPNNGEVVVASAKGADLTNVTNDADAFDITPAWGPGGTHIVYGRISLLQQIPDEIYVMASDGTAKTRVTRGWRPHWSADGSRIVFVDTLGARASDLFVVGPDGTERAALTNTPAVAEVDPEWSPDGSKIGYAADATGRFEVYVMNANGTEPRQLTSGGNGARRDPAWSPDGSRIAFVAEVDGSRDIYVMNADGTGVGRLTYGGGWEPSWRP